MEKQLTPAQMEALAPYEQNFEQAVKAAWCSYPGKAGIDLMLETWLDLTGHRYPYQQGCPNCLLNLVRDLGTLYFARKAAKTDEKAPEGKTTQPRRGRPANGKEKGKAVK